ncbi:Translation initiation factor 2, beta subunit (eIF-2beta) [Phaffia rhodozyma]|uniref:Translation initiation factor 2, beta subunit (EIF-2beta) n=1 Tax=Phaffia rhodozyma TaxID=264483 RepID=A0A0F7SKF7_PHARH|nr:Translation initiation factor 2, beta subunit (eIF-2beta) [Phaffia rhodozyma]
MSAELEEDNIFAGLKKKSKKSKKVEVEAEPEAASEESAPVVTKTAGEETNEAAAEDGEENLFADLKKKKKKKAAPVDLLGNDTVEDTPEVAAAAAETLAPDDFSDLKKKKKKSKKTAFDLEAFERELVEDGSAAKEGEEDVEGVPADYDEKELGDNVFGGAAAEDAGLDDNAGDESQAWAGTDREYTYDELLSRAFRILRSQNPELAGDRRRYTIAPPQMHKEGNKKTIFANLADICKRMHRSDEHVISFLFAELGTTGSVDGSHRLIIKGRYTQKHMENVLRRYIVEYVTCQTCKSPDTLLSKENRIFFMNCQSCGSRRSVAAIKSGFQAQVGRRKAQQKGP